MRSRILMVSAAALMAVACKNPEPPKRPLGTADASVDPATGQVVNPQDALSPQARTALDNGNQLFRAKQYTLALEQYRLAVKYAPDHGAPYYGVYMAADKLGDKKLADSAMAAFNAHSGNGAPMFTDSLMKKTHLEGAPAAAPAPAKP